MWQKIKNLYHLGQAFLYASFYHFPARHLNVIGVTGTDGKTTTVNLIYHILKEAGKKVSMISSINAVIGEKKYETGFHVTTPNPRDMQKYLSQAVKAGSEYFVLEATSHGLGQNRLFGCFFNIGVVTNITHEHLDYHKTYQNYVKAKAKLFRIAEVAVLNKDDRSYPFLLPFCKKRKCFTYSLDKKADFNLKNFKFETALPGKYNQSNSLAASAVALSLGITRKKIKKSLKTFKGIKGRMEEIKRGQDFKIIIDFAHTPNSLKNVLEILNKEKKQDNKLIAIFGAAGLRDKKKRSLMGKVSGKYADITVITAEDPRTEDLNKIIEKIAQGCLRGGASELDRNDFELKGKRHYFFRVPDRKEAIAFAIRKLARKDDIVVICGKGHEKTMCFGKKEYPWSDFKAVEESLDKK